MSTILFDWSSVAAIAGIFVVAIMAWQVRETRAIAQSAFEESFNEQYRKLARSIPVDALLGKAVKEHLKSSTREEVYCYLDFSEDQALYRFNGRIRRSTWSSWAAGIKAHIEKEEFAKVWNEVYTHSPVTFSYLARLKEENFKIDPKDWGTMDNWKKNPKAISQSSDFDNEESVMTLSK
jgi:hypothetical protein